MINGEREKDALGVNEVRGKMLVKWFLSLNSMHF